MDQNPERERKLEELKDRFGIDEKIAAQSGRTIHQVKQDFDRRIQRIFSTLPDSYFENREKNNE